MFGQDAGELDARLRFLPKFGSIRDYAAIDERIHGAFAFDGCFLQHFA